MGYLSDTLGLVNEDTKLIFVGTGVILVNPINQILIGKRVDNRQWCIPGGSLEYNEELEECAVREVKEETGVVVIPENLKLNSVKRIKEPVIKNGRVLHIVSVSYWTKIYDDIDFKIESKEFSKYCWASLSEIHKIGEIAPYTAVALKEYEKNLNNS